MVPAVAVNVAVVAAAPTVTVAGTLRSDELLLDRFTVWPPVGAATLKVTVQLEVPLEDNDAGVHVRADGMRVAFTGNVTMLLTYRFCAMVNWVSGSVGRPVFSWR